MATRTWLALAAGLLTASADDDAGSDYSRLQGVWSFAHVEVDGARQPEPPFDSNKLIISRDGRYAVVQGPRITRGRLRLDPTQAPMHYDVTITSGPNKGVVTRGIYEIAGDSYRICLPLHGKDRPSGFASQPGDGLLHFAFKREEQDPTPALIGVARQELQGTWQPRSSVLHGAIAKLTIDASGRAVVASDGKLAFAGTTRIDPTRSPMILDLTYTDGDFRGQTAFGIYELEDDVLTICRAAPGQPRPTEFSSTPGSGLTLTTYERQKAP